MKTESWHDLKINDRIRIVRIPTDWSKAGYHVPPCTRKLYEKLIQRGHSLRICEIDEWGAPWIRCRFRYRKG